MRNLACRLVLVSLLGWAAVAPSGLIPAAYGEGAPKIPVCPGLTVVGAAHDPAAGDYESISRVESVSDRAVTLKLSAQRRVRSAIRHVNVSRIVMSFGGIRIGSFLSKDTRTTLVPMPPTSIYRSAAQFR